jgi:hypothetical protein
LNYERFCRLYVYHIEMLGRIETNVAGGTLRIICSALFLIVVMAVWACGDKTTNPRPVTIRDGMRYFPVQQGNKWFYNNGQYTRVLSGDTTIAGVVCQRLLENRETVEAWTLTPARFAQHLLAGFLWFDPPLQIPLNLEKDKPFQTSALGRVAPGWDSPIDSARFEGTLTFTGYYQKEVADIMTDSCIGLHYVIKSTIYLHSAAADTSTDVYDEYYARGIGLVLWTDPEEPRYLDSAIINGIKVP